MKNWKVLLFAIILSVGCKKPYNPPVVSSPTSYLVVEGVININDLTTVKLSRTVNLSNAVTTNPVSGAQLTVEGDDGSQYGLNEVNAGTYQLPGVSLNATRKYRLDIKIDGKEYRSDYDQAKATPPIDSVGFIAAGDKLQLYVNTHDPKNDTHYYRFDYTETWRFHSQYHSSYISDGVAIVGRRPDQEIYYCFSNNLASTILLSSSAKLKQDIIYQAPLTEIVSTSEKIELKYSILVHEYALTEQSYKFWSSLKRNTEQLGSIFDAEPSEISGNIHNVADPKETVIGYISASTVQTKRIFISNEQLPQSWRVTYPYTCEVDSFLYLRPKTGRNEVAETLIPGIEIPVNGIFAPMNPKPIGFTGTELQCVDCTLRGTTQQPDFWQ